MPNTALEDALPFSFSPAPSAAAGERRQSGAAAGAARGTLPRRPGPAEYAGGPTLFLLP
jgi:hypothetical protein